MSEEFQKLMQEMGMEEVATLPEASVDVHGFVAPVWSGHMMEVSTDTDLVEYNKDADEQDAITPALSVPRGDIWTWNYWHATTAGRKEAQRAAKALGRGWANSVVFMGLKVDDVISLSDEGKSNFEAADINATCSVKTWQSKKYRHEYQLIVLPLAVKAIAECYREELGIDPDLELEFDISEFNVPKNDEDPSFYNVFTDDFFKRMCGDIDDKNGHLESVLFARREKLWAALGEEDARVFKPSGDGKFCTTSPILNQVLTFFLAIWPKPKWGKFTWIYDPRPDAVKNDYRQRLPGLLKLYKTEAEAKADVDIQDEETASDDGPAIPADWEGMEVDFMEELQSILKAVEGKPKKIQIRKVAAGLDITPEEAEAWV